MDQPDTAERLHRLPAYTCYSNYCAVLFMRVLVFCRVSLRKDASPLTRTVRSNCSFLFSFSLSACFSYCFAAPLTDRRLIHSPLDKQSLATLAASSTVAAPPRRTPPTRRLSLQTTQQSVAASREQQLLLPSRPSAWAALIVVAGGGGGAN